ncbi:peptidoglycan editing factor PgeF [Clostridium sardiniense]|uniref:Purine nucleoside phosphorylase n=1 Tax=Clostridium sardiniense TaxID=29369 RepID=A0ABS7KXF7_CLOSR|nr:peptidoglycan editing factor PgeF [Clostridium sardiniense]MBY0755500.1 peptidoglycan editing factor PgeF [Clostridium sardiniense]
MNRMHKENFKIKKDFLLLENNKSSVIFSTAEDERSFNRNTDEGIDAINSIKEDFNVDKVIYLNQIHSDIVLNYNDEIDFIENEGDGIITNKRNIAIGVFTADCVPVIIVNEVDGVIGAVHSGWKGTFNSITKKALQRMVDLYSVNHKNTKIYIGAHIRKCCYEVSEELKEKFIKEKNIKEDILFDGRNLSLKECIIKDVIDSGILEENIYDFDSCTYCEDKVKLHSYRKSNGSYGRLFSFVLLK